MKYKGVIFDFDGTLVDNNNLWAEYDGIFLRKYNIPHTVEYVTLVNGRSLPEAAAMIRDRFNIAVPLDELIAEKIACTEQIYDKTEAMPGINALLQRLHDAGVPMAIGSGCSPDRIERVLERLDWKRYFKGVASVEHVNNVGKPDPAVYHLALQHVGVPPKDCIVFEDGYNGLKAAHGAGMQCVMVKSAFERVYTGAALVINSFEDQELYSYLAL